jgi:predicted transcriptional regulator
MTPQTTKVSDAELGVLEILWKHGPATIRHLAEQLYGEGTTSNYATVQKLLERLESKGCVSRDRTGFAHVFEAKIERSALIGQGLQEMAERLCGGSLTPLLLHLAETAQLSAGDRKRIRKMIDETP